MALAAVPTSAADEDAAIMKKATRSWAAFDPSSVCFIREIYSSPSMAVRMSSTESVGSSQATTLPPRNWHLLAVFTVRTG